MRPRFASILLAFAAIGPGCQCGAGSGDTCSSNDDCRAGLFCNLTTGTCEPIGDGGVCPDRDGDGSDACTDCDDGDPTTYPGAPEICGDGIDNACGTNPDPMCMGMGTYVAPPPVGEPGATGTRADPVDTINEGMSRSTMIEAMGGPADLPVFVAAGQAGPGIYAEAITMVEGISLLGGHESAGWTRDSNVNVTRIDDQTANGLFFPGGITPATELSGFTINGMTGLSGEASAIEIANGSAPVIRANAINGPGTSGASRAVRINAGGAPNPASPLLEGNVIVLGPAGGGFGNGTFGVAIEATPAQVLDNDVQLLGDDVQQRGILSWSGVPGLVIARNRIRGAATGIADFAYGIEVGGDGVVIEANEIALGSCFQQCVGIGADGIMSIDIVNNVVYAGSGYPSTALRFAFENPAAISRDALVHSNTLDGGGAPGGQATSNAVELINFNPMTTVVVGRFINNILDAGEADFRFCFSENGVTIDPERLESNDFWLAPGAVISGLYDDEGLVLLMTEAEVNALADTTASMNFAADPLLVDPANGDVHLGAGSPCINVGSTLEVPAIDYEGDTRPGGSAPDVGADES